MLRLTKRMEDGSYQANNTPEIPGENSYEYKNMIIERCGKLEDLLYKIHDHLLSNDTMIDIFNTLQELDLGEDISDDIIKKHFC